MSPGRALGEPLAREGEGGQAVVLLALAMTGLLLGVGLAIDAGTVYVAHRSAQAGADSGAWAGAVALYNARSQAEALAVAKLDAARNGFADDARTTVIVNAPPTSGPYAGDARSVEVLITREVATTFLRGAASGLTRIRVRAVGAAAPVRTTHAIIALRRTGQETFRTDGNGTVLATGGGIVVNSSDGQAASLNGNGAVVSPYSDVVGGVRENGNARFTPPAVTGATVAPDPFWGLPYPATATLPVFRNTRVNRAVTLAPGLYEGGITVTANGAARLEPGIYVLKGGGLQTTGNGALLGSGVMLFNTTDNYPGDGGSCGDITIAGNGAVNLSAPPSGPYAGMLVYQDRRCSNDLSISGNGNLTSIAGTLYAPTALVKLTGNGSADLVYTAQVVANTVKWSGNGNLNVNYERGELGRPLIPTLVE